MPGRMLLQPVNTLVIGREGFGRVVTDGKSNFREKGSNLRPYSGAAGDQSREQGIFLVEAD